MPRFADIRGQDRAHALLRNALDGGRQPHAYLFHGTSGVGKTSTAFALAQFLNCEHPVPGDACGACRTCRLMDRLQHPDLHWIFPMPGLGKRDDRITYIHDVREARRRDGIQRLMYTDACSIGIGTEEDLRVGSLGELRHEAAIFPMEARVKVFVVSDAERMEPIAQNSLLKVLEEPLPGNLLILCSSTPEDLLPTIVSRCQTVRFRDLTEAEIAALLLERGVPKKKAPRRKKGDPEPEEAPGAATFTPEAAALAAALARGSVTRAVKLLEGGDLVGSRDRDIDLLHAGPRHPEAYQRISELAAKKKKDEKIDREPIEQLIDFGLVWTGDLLRLATESPLPLANRDREADLRREAAGLTVEEIRRRVTVLEQARWAFRGHNYAPLVVANLLHRLGDTRP